MDEEHEAAADAADTPSRLERLARAIAEREIELDAAEQRATLAVYGLLAGGHAVTARTLAERIGWARERTETFLDRFPRLEHDDLDRVVGFRGVSLRRTSHAVAVGHQVLFGWSAWDCLIVPLVTDAAARIRSTCPATRRQVEVVVTPGGVRRASPDTVVVSIRSPDTTSPEEERGGSRAVSRFLADREAGRSWLDRVRGGLLLELGDAFAVAQLVVGRGFSETLEGPSTEVASQPDAPNE